MKTFFSRVGTAEVASDPMGPNISDGYVMLKNRDEWPNPDKTKAELLDDIQQKMAMIPGNAYEVSQPIQLRFNELISGVRSDLGIKIYGDNLDQLLKSGAEIASILKGIEGAEGVKVEQISGLPILSVRPNPEALYRYGLNVVEVQDILTAATGGKEAGLIFEGDRRFSIVVRLAEETRNDLSALQRAAYTFAKRWICSTQ